MVRIWCGSQCRDSIAGPGPGSDGFQVSPGRMIRVQIGDDDDGKLDIVLGQVSGTPASHGDAAELRERRFRRAFVIASLRESPMSHFGERDGQLGLPEKSGNLP